MNKGVIVQLDYSFAYILKNDGEFVTCPRDLNWRVGDVVTLRHYPQFSLKAILISCSILFCLFVGTGAILYQIPTTYIEISINPSVQITLNRFNRVLSTEGLNDDGISLIQGTSYNNLTLDEAYVRLLNRLENNGYMNDVTIQLVIANNSQKTVDSIEQILRNLLGKFSQIKNIQIKVKRYANDEYLSLAHPLEIVDLPSLIEELPTVPNTENNKLPSQNPMEQQSEAPVNDNNPALLPSESLSLPPDIVSVQPSETPPSVNMPKHHRWNNNNWDCD